MRLFEGNCLDVLKQLPDNSVDSIVTDPPYGLSFMGKKWDYDVPSVEVWRECLRVLKHGGHLLAFAGSRTYHRMAVNIEDAGFEIRDQIMWVYSTGFPKSHNISKAIDKRGGESVAWFGEWLKQWRKENDIPQKEVAKLFPSKTGNLTGCVANWESGTHMPTNEQFNKICEHFNLPFENMEEAKRTVIKEDFRFRKNDAWESNGKGMLGSGVQDFSITASATPKAQQWDGWGSALKPAHEPIVVARKPLIGTLVENVLEHGTGGLNIDGCRIGTEIVGWGGGGRNGDTATAGASRGGEQGGYNYDAGEARPVEGRFPANFIHDGSDEVVSLFPTTKPTKPHGGDGKPLDTRNQGWGFKRMPSALEDNGGSAARFFYCAKASKAERNAGLEAFEDKKSQHNAGGIGRKISVEKRLEQGKENAPMMKNIHPTVKPVDLMKYLCRLVTPPEGVVLDPFMGSGTTGIAAKVEGFDFIGIEMDAEYLAIAEARIGHWVEEVETTYKTLHDWL